MLLIVEIMSYYYTKPLSQFAIGGKLTLQLLVVADESILPGRELTLRGGKFVVVTN